MHMSRLRTTLQDDYLGATHSNYRVNSVYKTQTNPEPGVGKPSPGSLIKFHIHNTPIARVAIRKRPTDDHPYLATTAYIIYIKASIRGDTVDQGPATTNSESHHVNLLQANPRTTSPSFPSPRSLHSSNQPKDVCLRALSFQLG